MFPIILITVAIIITMEYFFSKLIAFLYNIDDYMSVYKNNLDAQKEETEQELDEMDRLNRQNKQDSDGQCSSALASTLTTETTSNKGLTRYKSNSSLGSSMMVDVLTTTKLNRGIQPLAGDIITFKYKTYSDLREHDYDSDPDVDVYSDTDEDCSNYNDIVDLSRRPARSISTYGFIPIKPVDEYFDNESNTLTPKKYIINYIDSVIPNFKSGNTISGRDAQTTNVFLHVLPIWSNESEDESDSLDNSDICQRIFWYINLSDMTICQYEDGYPIGELQEIRIVKQAVIDDTDSFIDNQIDYITPIKSSESDRGYTNTGDADFINFKNTFKNNIEGHTVGISRRHPLYESGYNCNDE